ncbi:hypothetical protein D3C73_1235270 [compost metagenome]
MGLHADPVNQLFAWMSLGIVLIEFFNHAVDGGGFILVIIIVIIVVELDIPVRVFIEDFSGGEECLIEIVIPDCFVPAGLAQCLSPFLRIRRVIVHRFVDDIPRDYLVTEVLHDGLNMGP